MKSASILKLAKGKLLLVGKSSEASDAFSDSVFKAKSLSTSRNLLRLLAVMSTRLAITMGPAQEEAAEMVASHMAVCTATEKDRHYLTIDYPSEPLLAEASAELTSFYGWDNGLRALIHYAKQGVASQGWRGELVTKILCLMAMDLTLRTKLPDPERVSWTYMRPVRVKDFLNHWICPVAGTREFCEILKGVKHDQTTDVLNVDDAKLQEFLDGWIFFNHFIKVEENMTLSMLVHCWNRGAAVMCKDNTTGVDHIIPVIYHDPGDKDTKFGPLYGPWSAEHIESVTPKFSYIAINSKNYHDAKDHEAVAWSTRLSEENFSFADTTPEDTSRPAGNFKKGYVSRKHKRKYEDDSDDDASGEYGPNKRNEGGKKKGKEGKTKREGNDKMKPQKEPPKSIIKDNVFLSIIQQCGPKLKREANITVNDWLPPQDPEEQRADFEPVNNQFTVILKGIDDGTFKCLKDHVDDKGNTQSLAMTRIYLNKLKDTKRPYVEEVTDETRKENYEDWDKIQGVTSMPAKFGSMCRVWDKVPWEDFENERMENGRKELEEDRKHKLKILAQEIRKATEMQVDND
jgi:hypothetical protein